MLDPSLILCENCGYDVGSLEPRLATAPDLKCPECGKPVAESLPERRVGSAWQRRRARYGPLRLEVVGAWASNTAALARSPRSAWRFIRVDGRGGLILAMLHCFTASCLWVAALEICFATMYPDLRFEVGEETLTAIVLSLAGALFFLAATAVEALGLTFFGRRRGWRVTHSVVWTIVGHASAGWLLAPVTLIAPLAAIYGMRHSVDAFTLRWALIAALAFHVFAPLLAFEALVFLGFRAMRFANHPRESTA